MLGDDALTVIILREFVSSLSDQLGPRVVTTVITLTPPGTGGVIQFDELVH